MLSSRSTEASHVFFVYKSDLIGLGKGKTGIQQSILPEIKSPISPNHLLFQVIVSVTLKKQDLLMLSYTSGARVWTQ